MTMAASPSSDACSSRTSSSNDVSLCCAEPDTTTVRQGVASVPETSLSASPIPPLAVVNPENRTIASLTSSRAPTSPPGRPFVRGSR